MIMLFSTLFGALCYAYGETRTENEKREGIPIELIQSASTVEPSRSNTILPILDGHVLSLVFTENLGLVSIEVTTVNGSSVETTSIYTPNSVNIYIPNTGNYLVTFTLFNGDEYYGEFEVM